MKRVMLAVVAVLAMATSANAQRDRVLIPNEQGRFQVRDSGDYVPAPLPRTLTPPTVATAVDSPEWNLSLDEAIRIALRNTDVVRVLSGVGAASSGVTIYSPGIANASIDAARSVFDPTISARNGFLRGESPFERFDPGDPNRAIIQGTRGDDYDFSFDINKRFLSGADAGLRVLADRSRTANELLPLNPRTRSTVDLSLTQPLLRGAGVDVNSAPVVLAFLDTESSYFRLKNSLQNMVAGVIQGYWDLVQARVELWVVQQQIRQVEEVNDRATAQQLVGITNSNEVAQTVASLENFKANLIGAEASVLNRVASLRAIMGMPPGSDFTIVPTTPPVTERIAFNWDELVALAEQRRPDLVELKIVLEADRQRILQASNRSRPQLDAVALYRWNGLQGKMPIGDRIASDAGQFTDWSLAVNFSVPFTMRADRANLRQNELLLASDRANLQQGLLRASHAIASDLRFIEQLYAQYAAFKVARSAAEDSLIQQFAQFGVGRVIFVDVLLAINTWAGSVTSEARAVTQLNAALATLEANTGTILETHGVRLFEERYCSLGPLGRLGKGREYPSAYRPSENSERYEPGMEPAEEAFNLEVPTLEGYLERVQRLPADSDVQRLPPPEPTPPY